MADITREIEITAALSSDYQAAFNAATSIAKSTAKELSDLAKREADLARMTEIAGEAAKASAENDAKAVDRLNAEYAKLAQKMGLADSSAQGLAAEMARVGQKRTEVEKLNAAASKSAEIGRLARDIQRYSDAAKRVKDPALEAALKRMKTRFRELGGVIPDKKKLGFFQQLKSALAQLPGPIGRMGTALHGIREAFSTTGGRITLAVGAFGALTAVAVKAGKALWDLGVDAIKSGDAIAKTSRQIGIDAGAYQELAYAVGLGGASESEFADALRTLNRQMEAASQGNGKAAQAFKTLGISMAEVKSMNAEEMFVRLSDALSEVDDVAAKTRTTMALFGGSGDKVATAIAGGSAALGKMRTEARKAGIVMDGKALKKSEEAADNYTRATLQMRGVMRQLGVEVMPVVNDALVGFVKLVQDNRESISAFAHGVGRAFSVGMDIVVGAVKGISAAIDIFSGGLEYWQDRAAEMFQWIHDTNDSIYGFFGELPGKVSDAFSSAFSAVKGFFSDVYDSAGGWISGLIDRVKRAIYDAATSLLRYLRDLPLIGQLFEGDAPAVAGGGVTINVSTSVDARGAIPGAGAEVQRAVRAGMARSGEEIAAAMSQYSALSYSGASR